MKSLIQQKKLLFRILNIAFVALLMGIAYTVVSNKSKGQINQNSKYSKGEYSSGVDNNPFPNADYPFLHKDNTPNSLKPFFIQGDGSGKPDIVVILLESMGKAYSGKDAYLGSFTPFMDSLADHSLYWENCLSGGGRTFAALPTIFGSLPFCKEGYLEEGDNAPLSNSLIKILGCNGYTSSFYYGSEASFDKMDLYLKQQGANVKLEKSMFPSGYSLLPPNGGGFSWGYGDMELFKRYFELFSAINSPRMDIILTVANHSPFLLANQDYYFQKVKNRMDKINTTPKHREFLGQYMNQLSTIMYTDEALQYFFNEYSKKPSFKNTIFIITGDHRMPEIEVSTQIDRFHVPLIIYSPMLNKAANFKSVVTHFDITPTLLKLFNSNFGISSPSWVHWIGTGLDTDPNYTCTKKIALMRNKTQLFDYLDGMNFLSMNDKLYVLETDLDIEEIHDQAKHDKLQGEFDEYKKNNASVMKIGRLAPDSLLKCK